MSHRLDTGLEHAMVSGVEPPSATHAQQREGRPVRAHKALREIRPFPLHAAVGPVHPLADWLLRQVGVDARAYRRDSLRRRIPACLRRLRSSCPSSARRLLERRPELIPDAVSSVLIGVTDFFRDDGVFEVLGNFVLPELLASREMVRVLSAGVSTGEELYSVAMLLAESRALARSHLLGLDCRGDAIEAARRGRFGADELLRLNPALRQRYFLRHGSRWVVDAALRSRMEWRVANIFDFTEPFARDLILFRNVAIYLDRAHAPAAWARLCRNLSRGGFLIVGRAEQPPDSLPLRRVAASIYRRV